jgi:hypothetical protein
MNIPTILVCRAGDHYIVEIAQELREANNGKILQLVEKVA